MMLGKLDLQLPQVAKIALLITLGFAIGYLLVCHIASTDQDNEHELKDSVEPLLDSKPSKLRMVGGIGTLRDKDDEVVEAVNKVKSEFEAKTGKRFESIDVISYKPQTVAGKNYFVKARVKEVGGNTMIAHLRIYADISNNYELSAYQLDKKEEEEIQYFQ